MVLSDRSIREELAAGRLRIEPLSDRRPPALQRRPPPRPRSSASSARPTAPTSTCASPATTSRKLVEIDDDKPFIIHPGEFVLASTLETITTARRPRRTPRRPSSLGRLGLLVHATAGYVDPGWNGKLTLELSNVDPMPIAVYYGMKIARSPSCACRRRSERPYGSPGLGSKYQGQQEPTPSRIYQDFNDKKR